MFESIIRKALMNSTITLKGTYTLTKGTEVQKHDMDFTLAVKADESSDRTMRTEAPAAPTKK